MKREINENTKVTLTIGQIRKLIRESTLNESFYDQGHEWTIGERVVILRSGTKLMKKPYFGTIKKVNPGEIPLNGTFLVKFDSDVPNTIQTKYKIDSGMQAKHIGFLDFCCTAYTKKSAIRRIKDYIKDNRGEIEHDPKLKKEYLAMIDEINEKM